MPEDFLPRITVPDVYDRVTVLVAMRSYVESLNATLEFVKNQGDYTPATVDMFQSDYDRASELLDLLSSNR